MATITAVKCKMFNGTVSRTSNPWQVNNVKKTEVDLNESSLLLKINMEYTQTLQLFTVNT